MSKIANPLNALTNRQVATAFAISNMTLLHWRAGTATREPMPFHTSPDSGRPYYKSAELIRWAKKNAAEIHVAFDKVILDSGAADAKRGRKATAPAAGKKSKPVAVKQARQAPAKKKAVAGKTSKGALVKPAKPKLKVVKPAKKVAPAKESQTAIETSEQAAA